MLVQTTKIGTCVWKKTSAFFGLSVNHFIDEKEKSQGEIVKNGKGSNLDQELLLFFLSGQHKLFGTINKEPLN